MKLTYGKSEKLKSKKAIEQLFMEGDSVSSYPFRLVYLETEHTSPSLIQAGVSVPKRKIPKAVHRNKIKRLMREAYRLNKHAFVEGKTKKYTFMFLYLGNEIYDFDVLDTKIKKLAVKFSNKVLGSS